MDPDWTTYSDLEVGAKSLSNANAILANNEKTILMFARHSCFRGMLESILQKSVGIRKRINSKISRMRATFIEGLKTTRFAMHPKENVPSILEC